MEAPVVHWSGGVVAAVALCAALASPAHAATRLLAPGGTDAGDCASGPCASFDYAYGQAAAGDEVTIAPGVYPAQNVSSGSKPVTFRGLPGNKVRKLDIHAANTTFDGLDVDAGFATPDGAALEIHGVANVTFKNGRVGNVTDQKGALLGGWETPASMGTVIDNVEFHDVLQVGEDVHNECIFSEAPGLTVRNSTFRNCATMDLMITRGDWWGQPSYGGVTLENNVFAHSVNGSDPRWHAYGLLLHGNMGQLTDVRVVNNTFENSVGGITTEDVSVASGVWANNIGGGWDCLSGVTYRGNVGKKCDGSDIATAPPSSCAPPACPWVQTAPVGWVDPSAFDFHLLPGSIAIGVGDPAFAPATDRDCRVRDARPDAGAYEFGAPRCAKAPVAAPPPAAVSRPRVRAIRLRPRTICRHARRGCPATATLRVTLSRRATLAVRVDRLGRGSAPRRARTLTGRTVPRHTLQRTARISARVLRPGRYRVALVATDTAGVRSSAVRLALRVR